VNSEQVFELVDIGVNLDHRSFDKDRTAVLQRALEAGVKTLVLTGTNVRSSQAVLELARSESLVRLYSTAGVHPHDAQRADDRTLSQLRNLAAAEQVVAIGECGLDFDRDFSPRPVQERWFEAQLELACELNLPVFLHERAAHVRFAGILSQYRSRLAGGVVHCFTGTREELETYLAMGLHIGITGWICDERRGLALRELVKYIPLDRLMLETDAPFLTPRNMRPKPKNGRNEPAFLPVVLEAVAQELGRPVSDVAAATTHTARQFFKLDQTAV